MKTLFRNDVRITQTLIIAVVLYGWIAYTATLLGVFYPLLVWLLWFVSLGFLYLKKIISLPKPSQWFMKLFGLCLSIALISAFFTVPTIFSGRDQGSISNAAIYLTQYHSPYFQTPTTKPFFDIYGPGKALNFPGFHYTNTEHLVTQFPLPYISFIAGFYALTGLSGLILANTILLIVSLLSFSLFARHFITQKYTLWAPLLLSSSFAFIYFTKFTLTENLASALLWSALLLFLFFVKNPTTKNYFTFLALIGLLAFTRIEGLWFLPIFLFLFFYNPERRAWVFGSAHKRFIMPLTAIITYTLLALVINTAFYKTLASTFLPKASNTISETSSQMSTFFSFLIPTYTLYNLFIPLLCSAIFVILLLKTKQLRSLKLLPFVVILPLFFYFYDPQISGDHPWMLRRFMFAIVPTLTLGTLFLAYYFDAIHKKFSFFLLFVVLSANMFITSLLFFTQEHKDLHYALNDISHIFTSHDLVLLAPDVTGDNWTMLAEPLSSIYNIPATYFFNAMDYSTLDTSSFDRVFLITPQHSVLDHSSLTDNLTPQKTFAITTSTIKHEKRPSHKRPSPTTLHQTSLIYQLK